MDIAPDVITEEGVHDIDAADTAEILRLDRLRTREGT